MLQIVQNRGPLHLLMCFGYLCTYVLSWLPVTNLFKTAVRCTHARRIFVPSHEHEIDHAKILRLPHGSSTPQTSAAYTAQNQNLREFCMTKCCEYRTKPKYV